MRKLHLYPSLPRVRSWVSLVCLHPRLVFLGWSGSDISLQQPRYCIPILGLPRRLFSFFWHYATDYNYYPLSHTDLIIGPCMHLLSLYALAEPIKRAYVVMQENAAIWGRSVKRLANWRMMMGRGDLGVAATTKESSLKATLAMNIFVSAVLTILVRFQSKRHTCSNIRPSRGFYPRSIE